MSVHVQTYLHSLYKRKKVLLHRFSFLWGEKRSKWRIIVGGCCTVGNTLIIIIFGNIYLITEHKHARTHTQTPRLSLPPWLLLLGLFILCAVAVRYLVCILQNRTNERTRLWPSIRRIFHTVSRLRDECCWSANIYRWMRYKWVIVYTNITEFKIMALPQLERDGAMPIAMRQSETPTILNRHRFGGRFFWIYRVISSETVTQRLNWGTALSPDDR